VCSENTRWILRSAAWYSAWAGFFFPDSVVEASGLASLSLGTAWSDFDGEGDVFSVSAELRVVCRCRAAFLAYSWI